METGETLSNFSLKDTNGEAVTKFDFADKYALLLIVTCNHCPYAQAYWKRLINLAKKYEEDNLGVAAICGNDDEKYPADSYKNMQELARQMNLPFPYLHDEDQSLMKALGATRTPHAFLFNSKRELVYKGAIDDSWENEQAIMIAYLEDAIEYCLDGVDIDYPETEPVGCSIKWKPERSTQ